MNRWVHIKTRLIHEPWPGNISEHMNIHPQQGLKIHSCTHTYYAYTMLLIAVTLCLSADHGVVGPNSNSNLFPEIRLLHPENVHFFIDPMPRQKRWTDGSSASADGFGEWIRQRRRWVPLLSRRSPPCAARPITAGGQMEGRRKAALDLRMFLG